MSASSLAAERIGTPVGGLTAEGSAAVTRSALGLMLAIFLMTGASGLVYEVLWQRMLALVFGVSAYATATVLAAFMGGLALGGFVAGRLADRLERPLLWYGVAEIVIGLLALLTPAAFGALQELYRAVYGTLGPTVAPIVRMVVAFAALLIPTALMGASFPLVVKAAVQTRNDGGRAIGLLYAINTFGAVAGTLAAGFLLVGQLGITTSIGLAAALNTAAGALAIWLARRTHRPAPPCHPERSEGSRSSETALGHRGPRSFAALRMTRGGGEAELGTLLIRLLPALLAVSGFCSLAYEVVWVRLLVLFLETTTYAFTVMLAAFLGGIALGSALVSPFLRRVSNGPLGLAALQAMVAVTSLLSVQIVARMEPILAALGAGAGAQGPSIAAMAALSFVVMFPPALFLGMSFPLAVTLYTMGRSDSDGEGAGVGRRLGALYAANVFGAVFGSLAAGFVLIPVVGTQRTIQLLALLNWGIAAVVLAADAPVAWRVRAAATVGSLAVVAGLVGLAPSAHAQMLRARFPGEQVIWSEEGIETTVTVTRGEDRRLAMYLNRHHQANDADWMVFFHRMLGHLPMLLHPDPREVLVVGLGGGATAGATTRYENAQITVVELSRSVVRGAEQFRGVNYAVVSQPNVRMLVDDGRNHLLVSGRKYDVITADAIWPTHAGSTNLYSVEYYRLARAALNEGGLMLQWVNRDLPEPQHKLMMRTFLEVFPHVSLWFDGSLLVGSEQPIDPALPWLQRKFDWPLSKGSLQQVNIRSPDDVTKLFVDDRAGVAAYAGDGPVISDDHPYLEYFLGLSTNSGPGR